MKSSALRTRTTGQVAVGSATVLSVMTVPACSSHDCPALDNADRLSVELAQDWEDPGPFAVEVTCSTDVLCSPDDTPSPGTVWSGSISAQELPSNVFVQVTDSETGSLTLEADLSVAWRIEGSATCDPWQVGRPGSGAPIRRLSSLAGDRPLLPAPKPRPPLHHGRHPSDDRAMRPAAAPAPSTT